MTLPTTCTPPCGGSNALPLAVPACFACPPTALAFGQANVPEQKTENTTTK
jgi:hypothetical protein